jgi:hypothetical protein
VGFLVFFAKFIPPANRLVQLEQFRRRGTTGVALLLAAVAVIATLLFAIASGFVEVPQVYWPLKVVASIVAVGLSLIVSVAYEESVISAIYRRFRGELESFMTPVIWANIVGVLALVLAGAIIAMPKRLSSPDFLYTLRRTRQAYGTSVGHGQSPFFPLGNGPKDG